MLNKRLKLSLLSLSFSIFSFFFSFFHFVKIVMLSTITSHNRYHLKDAVLEGGLPFYKAYGMSAVEYIGKDDKFREIFKGSMKDFNALVMKKILEKYKGFEGLKLLVDVGGGDGTILNMIISKHPTIKGVNFDLASVLEKSPSYPGMNFNIWVSSNNQSPSLIGKCYFRSKFDRKLCIFCTKELGNLLVSCFNLNQT